MSFPISDVKRRVVYSGSAGTGPYSFSFEILANTDIDVYKNSTLLTLTTDYTVFIDTDGTGSVTLVSAATSSDNITLVGARSIERSTDFVTGGDLFANTLNQELDSVVIFAQQVDEKADRGLKAPITDPTDINMVLPVKTSRRGKVLAFDETSGDPVAGPDLSAMTTVIAQSANINTVAANIASVNTVAGNTSNVNTVAGISGNVTTVAGISSNVTAVAGNSTNINAVAGNATNINAVAGNATNINNVASNATNINAVAADATDIGTVASNISNVNAVGTNISNVNAVAGNATNINAVNANSTNINTVATNIANVNAVGTNIANVNAVAGNATNINAVVANASNINQVASDTVAINAASANASAAAASATSAANSATAAATSAAQANAVSLSNEPIRHSVRPSLLLDFANTEQLDPRITFTRASQGRFYGTQVAKAEENLLLQSQGFDVTANWGPFEAAATGGQTAPDGTSTAFSLVESATAAVRHQINQSNLNASGQVTFSLFAKLGSGTRFLVLSVNRATTHYASAAFDLTAGTVTQTLILGYSGSVTTSITAVGGGFFRCSITVTTDTATQVAIGLSNTSTFSSSSRGVGAYDGDGTSSLIIWGAQLEQRSSVTAYTPTTDQPITNYIPVLQTAAAGVARFDHNPVTGESLGLLIEEQRTNLLVRSEEFDNASWTKTRSSITANTIVAPDGTLTGDKLVENTDNNTHTAYQIATLIAGTNYTGSLYVKAAERTRIRIVILAAGGVFADANLSAGTIGAATAFSGGTATASSITPVGNGWYRITVTGFGTSTNGTLQIELLDASGNRSYQGDGYSGLYIWGAQLEAGAFPTSYIPTVASQVTRSADAASMTGADFSSWYSGGGWTIYSETQQSTLTSASVASASFNDAGANNRATVFLNSSSFIAARNTNGAGTLFTPSTANAPTLGANKAALAVANFDVALCGNGGTVATASTYNVPTVTRLEIGQQLFGAYLNGHIRKLAYYPKRLTNAELQGLTS